jgi:hypothetical protein
MSPPLSPRVTGPSAWTGAELAADPSWIYCLTAAHVAELEAGVESVRARGLKLFQFGAEDFPLARLEAMLDDILEQLENGRGCALVRGLDAGRYDKEALQTIYWGIAVHLGRPISQNAKGELICHVKDSGRDYFSKNVRGYTTRSRLAPHCDPVDAVGLLCAHPAMKGGESVISSAMTVYNEILATHPEYLAPLAAGFHYDLRGEGVTDDPEEVTFNQVPVFSYFDGKLSCRFNGKSIIEGQIKAGRPLAGVALAAVKAVAEIAARPGIRYDMTFERGDIQLLNNHVVLHSREAFEDYPEPERRRDLLRLWVNVRNGRKLAPEFAEKLNTGPRGGVMARPDAGA